MVPQSIKISEEIISEDIKKYNFESHRNDYCMLFFKGKHIRKLSDWLVKFQEKHDIQTDLSTLFDKQITLS